MTYEEIFNHVKSEFGKGDPAGFNGDFAIQINLTGEGEGAFYIAYKGGKLDVAPYEYLDRDAILTISGEDFLKLADGQLAAVPAFFAGKLKVDGSIDKALEMQSLIDHMIKKSKKGN